ncbi:MAG: HAD family hydrolase [Candidatus Obscuribacterales bacterium]
MSLTEELLDEAIITIERAENLLIDLDGTLIDSLPCLETTYFDFLSGFGKAGSREEFAELIGPPIEEVVTILRERYNLEQDTESLLADYHGRMDGNYSLCQAMKGADDLLTLAGATGRRLALVTGADAMTVTGILKRLGWSNRFDVVVTACDSYPEHKPSPVPYLKALAGLGTTKESCLVLEDSLNGIKSATAAGLASIAITAGNHDALRQAGAGHCLTSLSALVELSKRAWQA